MGGTGSGLRKNRVSVVRSHLVCRKCGGDWEYDGKTLTTNCPFCGAVKEARVRKYHSDPKAVKKLHDWNKKNWKEIYKKSSVIFKKRLFFRVSGLIHPKCVRCGCDDIRLIEVNHKFGGGNKEYQKGKKVWKVHQDIVRFRRKTDDLELLCKPCNAIHYLEMKYGKLPVKVVWEGKSQKGEQDA